MNGMEALSIVTGLFCKLNLWRDEGDYAVMEEMMITMAMLEWLSVIKRC